MNVLRSMTDKTPVWEIKRELQTLAQAETNPQFGRSPSERSINEHLRLGIINLNKPPNPSSHEVTSWVRKILGVSHAGHGGTLEAKKPGRPHGYRCTAHSA
jgi:H/ACA ribonucleoprotein complex subunit 4